MERLTRPTVDVDVTAAKYMAAPGSIPADLQSMNDRLLDLVINGPTLNGVNKDILRQMIRQLYAALKLYEDTGLEPDKLQEIQNDAYDLGYQSCLNYKGLKWSEAEELQRYREADQQGRLVVLSCKVGDVVYKPVHGIDGDGVWEIEVGIIDYDWHPDGSMTAQAIGTVLPDHGGAMLNMADFGKDWFLTREAAERALKGENNEKV